MWTVDEWAKISASIVAVAGAFGGGKIFVDWFQRRSRLFDAQKKEIADERQSLIEDAKTERKKLEDHLNTKLNAQTVLILQLQDEMAKIEAKQIDNIKLIYIMHGHINLLNEMLKAEGATPPPVEYVLKNLMD